ncbi:MAG: hypothetical protein KTR26_21690 [Flammeovirgaceae bacterium]|nr:hypothetical protein [Flammeovirgaceae bacterium]
MSSLRFTLITSGFYLGEEYIASNYCENIESPQLQCHGKCVLEKSIKSASQQKNQENGKIFFIDFLTKFNYIKIDILAILFQGQETKQIYFTYLQVFPHQQFENHLLIPPEDI